jgi:parallel beta-helix repeat protein
MSRRTVSVVIVAMLLAGMLTVAFNVQPVRSDYVWTETIYIWADGSVQPSTAPISSVDNVTYTLTDNIVGNVTDSSAIIIRKDNIIIDGAGHTLQGTQASNSTGIELYASRNATIVNMKITAYGRGIWLASSSNNTISGNNITASKWDGIYLYSSSNNSVSGNNITASNATGIGLYSSSNNTIYRNNLNNTSQVYSYNSTNVWDDGYPSGGNYWSNYPDVDLYSGPYQNETGSDGIWDHPYVIDAYNQDNYPLMTTYVPFENQTIYIRADGSIDPLRAPIQRSGNFYTFTGNINGSIVVERNNTLIDGNHLTLQGSGSGYGIYLFRRENVTVRNAKIKAFGYGIWLDSSSNNTVTGNDLTEVNGNDGIGLYGSSNYNSITGNNIANNGYGVWLDSYSSNNSVSGNNITNNFYGIGLYGASNNSISGNNVIANSQWGISLLYSSSNSMTVNNITTNGWYGIILYDSENNSISGNNIANNDYGIELESFSDYNMIYHNNFIDNSENAHVSISGGYSNAWDDGYPSGGNYWSDYSSRYPDATEIDASGIWNTPYVIDANNIDNYPLVNPWTPTLPYVIPTAIINVRSYPGIPENDANVITKLPKGSVLQIVEHPDNGKFVDGYHWWYVKFGIVKGWVAEEYVKGYDFQKQQPKTLNGVSLTAYHVCYEGEMAEGPTVINPPKITGAFYKEFLYSAQGVAMQGTGRAIDGRSIKYLSGGGGWVDIDD